MNFFINLTLYFFINFILTFTITTNIEKRIDFQERAIAKLKYIDFLINVCYDKQIINNKKYLRFGENIENIIRYIVAWKNANKTI